jgi:spermidine dehydrogenase
MHSFPGGNAGTVRKLVKALLPAAIRGGESLSDVLFQPVDFDALDRAGSRTRLRLRSTAVDVRHEGRAGARDSVQVVYLRDGRLRRVHAANVVMAGGQWMNKHVLADAPAALVAAMNEFHHAPILTVSVALRNWRFMDRLGIAAARWFDGFGWFTTLRRQMLIDGRAPMPLHPDKPTVLTMFVPFLSPGLPVAEQAVVGRMQLFGLSYAQIERAVRQQLTILFAGAGFDATRDIAGITTNRWGHAYVAQPPGFYFGRDGEPPPRDVVRAGYGRIGFAHSELQGAQSWTGAVEEGQRAARALLRA